jgi:hypothetical protein
VASRGGETRQCKNENSAKDDYESAHDIIGTRAADFSNLEFLRIQDPNAALASAPNGRGAISGLARS